MKVWELQDGQRFRLPEKGVLVARQVDGSFRRVVDAKGKLGWVYVHADVEPVKPLSRPDWRRP